MRIMVVDDSAIMRRIIIKALTTTGSVKIVEAENGEEALANLHRVDLLLTDWNMPVMDGLTMVKEIRKNPVWADLPIIMITSQAGKKEVIEALKNGVNDYIVKPFTAATLVEKVQALAAQET